MRLKHKFELLGFYILVSNQWDNIKWKFRVKLRAEHSDNEWAAEKYVHPNNCLA